MHLEHNINIAINGPLWMEVANPEHPFMAMLISLSRGTCLIEPASTFMVGDKQRCRGPHAPRDTFMSIMRRERGSRSERVICSDGGFGDREGSESSF